GSRALDQETVSERSVAYRGGVPSRIRSVGAHHDLARRGYSDGRLEVRSGAARRELGAAAVRIGPRGSAIGAFGNDDVVRALVRRGKTAGVVPSCGEVLRVARIDRDLREVLAADVQRLDTLLRPAAEVAERGEGLIVDAHFDGRADALEIGADVNAELLVDERWGVEVVEDHEDAAVTEDDRHRALVDVARVREYLRVEGVAEGAQRRSSADLDRRGPVADPLGQHDRRLAEATTVERSLATRISAEVGPGDVDLRVTGT